jgi:hypothetical protein
LRVSDNRFKEVVGSVAFSAITLGSFNTTTDNQATHCLLIAGSLAKVDTSNIILNPSPACGAVNKLFQSFFK